MSLPPHLVCQGSHKDSPRSKGKEQKFNFLLEEHQIICGYVLKLGFPGSASGEEPACQCPRHKRHRFNSWVGKIPWRRKRQCTSVFLPGKFHRQRSLVSCSPCGHRGLDMTEPLNTYTHTHTHTHRVIHGWLNLQIWNHGYMEFWPHEGRCPSPLPWSAVNYITFP